MCLFCPLQHCRTQRKRWFDKKTTSHFTTNQRGSRFQPLNVGMGKLAQLESTTLELTVHMLVGGAYISITVSTCSVLERGLYPACMPLKIERWIWGLVVHTRVRPYLATACNDTGQPAVHYAFLYDPEKEKPEVKMQRLILNCSINTVQMLKRTFFSLVLRMMKWRRV